MGPGVALIARYVPRPVRSGRTGSLLLLIGLTLFLGGCSSTPLTPREISELAPLEVDGERLTVADVDRSVHTPDLLAVDDDMRDFVELYVGSVNNSRQRVRMLHNAVTGAGALDMQYDPFAEGTAEEAFHRGTANCLSYANLFVALAREAGLSATYQWQDVRPQWNRMGELVVRRLHVNVLVVGRDRSRYVVDIDPLPMRDVAGTREMTDREAVALYHNNLAMDALAHEEFRQAWMHAVRALQISPREADLWVNLGAIYRNNGQQDEAERSYLYALELNPRQRSAMNNLAVLYGLQERHEEQDYWLQQVERYRLRNPYYHAWLGDKAADSGDWHEALQHYSEALDILPDDSALLYATGLIYYELDDLGRASGYIERAIDAATLKSQISTYQVQLESVKREQLAGT